MQTKDVVVSEIVHIIMYESLAFRFVISGTRHHEGAVHDGLAN